MWSTLRFTHIIKFHYRWCPCNVDNAAHSYRDEHRSTHSLAYVLRASFVVATTATSRQRRGLILIAIIMNCHGLSVKLCVCVCVWRPSVFNGNAPYTFPFRYSIINAHGEWLSAYYFQQVFHTLQHPLNNMFSIIEKKKFHETNFASTTYSDRYYIAGRAPGRRKGVYFYGSFDTISIHRRRLHTHNHTVRCNKHFPHVQTNIKTATYINNFFSILFCLFFYRCFFSATAVVVFVVVSLIRLMHVNGINMKYSLYIRI